MFLKMEKLLYNFVEFYDAPITSKRNIQEEKTIINVDYSFNYVKGGSVA